MKQNIGLNKKGKRTLTICSAQRADPDKDIWLIEAFHRDYPKFKREIRTVEQVRVLTERSTSFRDWYNNLKFERSVYTSMPQFLRTAGYSATDWSKVQDDYRNFKESVRDVDMEIQEASRKHKLFIDDKNKEKLAYLSSCPDLIGVLNLTVDNLPLEHQVAIAVASEDKRSDVADAYVNDMRRMAAVEVRKGTWTNPFKTAKKSKPATP